MISDLPNPVVRRLIRAVALTPAVLAFFAAGPALAVAPENWPKPDPVSTLHALVILVVIPVGLIVVITLLVYVPSMARGEKYQPGLAWRSQPEWFGGPSGGIEAVEKATAGAIEGGGSERGGASGRW